MSADLLSAVVEGVLLAGAAAAFSVFLARWLAPRVRPEIPPIPVVMLAVISAVASGFASLTQDLVADVLVAVVGPLLLASSYVDLRVLRIPNAFVVQGVGLAAAGAVALASTGRWQIAALAAAAAGIGFVLLTVLALLHPGFGMGDAKLAPVIVFVLAVAAQVQWPAHLIVPGAEAVMLALVVSGWFAISSLLGGGVALVRRLRGRTDGLPFGPCMAVGFWIALALTPLLAGLAHQLG